jgi:beta-phosphoglucomutase
MRTTFQLPAGKNGEKNMNASSAVIFDMDGVLVDSYKAHYQSWRSAAQRIGLHLDEKEFAATFGRTSREIIEYLWGQGRLSDAEIAAFDERKEADYREIIAVDFPHMPGAKELLVTLDKDGFKLAVGSSGPPENVEMVLNKLDARQLFGAAITGRDVTRGKPDPQVFLLAAERLGVPPARCVVVEDARPGILAAHAAGMKAVGVVSTGRVHADLDIADRIVSSLEELAPPDFKLLIDGEQK